MTTHLLGRSGALRLLIGSFVLAVIGSFLTATPADARADNWSGVWHTHHQFDDVRMKLDLDPQKGPDDLDGTYKNASDGRTGKINGTVVRDGGPEVWTGRFKDDDGACKGKFRIVLQSDQVSFKGWFKICGTFTCSEKYTWTGEHA
jgi:hypothetical protein